MPRWAAVPNQWTGIEWIASYYVLSALTIISTFMYSDFAMLNQKA